MPAPLRTQPGLAIPSSTTPGQTPPPSKGTPAQGQVEFRPPVGQGPLRQTVPPVGRGPLRQTFQETFSRLGAVLEPQSRGVLIRDKLESQGCQWGLPAVFMGSEEGDLAEDAAFPGHSRDIERALPVQLFVNSAGPIEGLLSAGACAACLFPAIPLKRATRDKVRRGLLGSLIGGLE